jgi:cytochrome c
MSKRENVRKKEFSVISQAGAILLRGPLPAPSPSIGPLQRGGSQAAQQGGSMGGIMGGGQVPNLKKLDPADRVQAITYCKDTYTVTTANGQTRKFWERNLRLKTDASVDGPEKNAPALLNAGMMGDRADIIFAEPSEISPLIAAKCE